MQIASLHWEFGKNWKAGLCDTILFVGRVRSLEPQLDSPTFTRVSYVVVTRWQTYLEYFMC